MGQAFAAILVTAVVLSFVLETDSFLGRHLSSRSRWFVGGLLLLGNIIYATRIADIHAWIFIASFWGVYLIFVLFRGR